MALLGLTVVDNAWLYDGYFPNKSVPIISRIALRQSPGLTLIWQCSEHFELACKFVMN